MSLWIVLKVTKWENLKFENDVIKIQPQKGMFGLCHVFDDYEEALKQADGDLDLVCLVRTI